MGRCNSFWIEHTEQGARLDVPDADAVGQVDQVVDSEARTCRWPPHVDLDHRQPVPPPSKDSRNLEADVLAKYVERLVRPTE